MSSSSGDSTNSQQLYLVQYASCEYAQFRFAEFASLAGLAGCRFATVFTGWQREAQFPSTTAAAAAAADAWSQDLFDAAETADAPAGASCGIHDWRGCPWQDASRVGLCTNWWRTRPLVVVRCDDEQRLRQVVERSALAKRLLKVWQSTATRAEMLDAVSTSGQLADCVADARCSFDTGAWSSWRMCIEVVNVSVGMQAKVDIVEQFGTAGLDMPGRVDLKRPDFELYYVEHWRYDLTAGSVTDKTPVGVYLAAKLCVGRLRAVLPKLCLSRRTFIGNTSMNVQLAFVMCNLARVTASQLVVDPFVGSGSILVSAGHLGAYCLGQDVDYNIVLGLGKSTKAEKRRQLRSEDECLAANFAQYGMSQRYLDCLVGDASQHYGLWRRCVLFDAVLTDPPYGIRERSRKVKRDPDGGPKKPDQDYYPPKEHYSLGDSVGDLLTFAALRLAPGGRCVFWFPVIQADYRGAESLPGHPQFRLVASVELPMTLRTSRVLVCLERLAGGGDEAAADEGGGCSATIVTHDHHHLRSSHYSGSANSRAAAAMLAAKEDSAG